MVSLLLLSRGLRKEGNNEKKRKREKRNEIQCMILLKSLIFVPTKPEFCLKKEGIKVFFSFLNTNKKILYKLCADVSKFSTFSQ